MTEKSYQIVFFGQMVDGVDPVQVKSNLCKLFKADASKIDKLLQSKRVVLKKNLNEDSALKYLTALKGAGAICTLEEMPVTSGAAENNKSTVAATSVSEGQGQTQSQASDINQASARAEIDTGDFESVSVAAPGEVIMPPQKIEPPDIDTSGIDMAPAGEDLVEPAVVDVPDIDTSGIDMAPAGEDLVEQKTIEAPDIDTTSLSVAAVGETLVEHVEVEPLVFDLSEIDLAPVGSDIGPEETEKPPPPPDTSHISLE